MLNQRMSDIACVNCLVWEKIKSKPHFILLDEAYLLGTSGAQAALVLRRWRHLLNSPVIWCGLSATSRKPPDFFHLTGLNPDQVIEITPQTNELVQEGAEYQLLLKGDPTLQAITFTSIQSAMLLARMLTLSVAHTLKVYSVKGFIFTDDLDVTNRLFDNLRDAEAYDYLEDPMEPVSWQL